ncbi:T-lymphocyte activation antigen CD80-like [Archocentrus centrarchus]|uniref:T-lymphocyte activation antigen CD80-like n=1 Tax=Archocentrus centrarchus TaxID=63155 RepID=UPI0011E9B5C5|nr:T-lymphocyte activation antigen CD80-like [Archocentrus centrarchus]XP_030604460.1 T-lymphocyte activation antigen CD80-like [Archocentrus centrarchus]
MSQEAFSLMSTCQCLSICSSLALVCLLCSLSSGSSQSVRNGYVGDDVLLPCIYPGQLPDKVNAFWRDKDDRVVLDIINGREDKTDPKFKGRVFSYPDQYKKGNLSILIKDLRADDAGSYDCHIPRMDYESRLTLRLTEKPAVKVMLETPPPAARDAAVTSSLHPALLSAPLFVLFCLLK